MYEIELIVFGVSCFFSYKFFKLWYQSSYGAWPSERVKFAQNILMILPAVSFIIMLYTLNVLASFDVVGSAFYILFYILLGYACIYLSIILTSLFFDISWIDDGLNLANKAVLAPIAGSFLAITIIYSGANIGDGPGWWCVIFAGGLGLCAWFLLGITINRFTNIFERITVERDICCGIRIGGYLLGSGIILGRASAGDWISFGMTIVEFIDGWPVLVLALLASVVEIYYISRASDRYAEKQSNLPASAVIGIFYVIISILFVMLLPPLKQTGLYSNIFLFVS